MEIITQAWWGFVRPAVIGDKKKDQKAEEVLKKLGHIVICAITIDGKIAGEVTYDGQKLGISERLKDRPREALSPPSSFLCALDN